MNSGIPKTLAVPMKAPKMIKQTAVTPMSHAGVPKPKTPKPIKSIDDLRALAKSKGAMNPNGY